MTEDDARRSVIDEAESWIATPYHHMARVKGVGVDCLTLLVEVYERAGIISHVEVPYYAPDWNQHRDVERYVEAVLVHGREIDGPPSPGDIVLFKFGRCFAHGAIVTRWPRLIHAWHRDGVRHGDATQARLCSRETRFFCMIDDWHNR